MLTFDPEAHQYFWQGKPVVNVTRVIGDLIDLSGIPADTLETARQQGVAIHSMVELDCKDDLDVETLPEWMRGHHEAWRKFRADTGFELLASERRLYHPKIGYAGTLDLAGVMPNLRTSRFPAIVDVKRSLYADPAAGVQTAAYEDAWNATEPIAHRARERYGLQLRANGTYRLHQFGDASDFNVFLACLTTYRWKEKHGKPL